MFHGLVHHQSIGTEVGDCGDTTINSVLVRSKSEQRLICSYGKERKDKAGSRPPEAGGLYVTALIAATLYCLNVNKLWRIHRSR